MLSTSSDSNKTHIFREDFKYKHDNPYHEKLEIFEEFVLRDEEAENNAGNWPNVFQNSKPLEVEIGTGYGHFMHEHCEKNPNINFIGLDFRFKRSFQLARKLSQIKEKNFRYLRARGERIKFIFNKNEVDKFYYFFPDPWPKNRHHKKRLFQMPFLESVNFALKPKGELLIKTDHDEYFKWMQQFAHKQDMFDITLETTDLYKEHPEHFLSSFQTKFEKIFLKQEIKIKAMVLKVKE